MPPLSIYERGGTAASNNLNADTISQFVRNQYANNRTQANLMVASSILNQNVLVRDLLGKNALIQRREAQLKELDEQLTQYYGEFGSVLNDKALDFLRQMADVKVPTVTSILAGFEGARASRAENERLRVAEMERLMNLDTKLQQERLQIRREQMDAEMLPGQTRIKAMQDLMSNANAVNSEAFKETKYSGTWQELPTGRIYNSPTASVQPVHDYWVDDRERIYGGGKGSKITDVDDLIGINLGERPSSTNAETAVEEAAKIALAYGSEPLDEYFIRMGESAPSGDASGWARALGADLKKQLEASAAKHREYSADGQTPFDPYTAIPNNDLINYGKMLAFMRERLNENEALRGHFRSSFPVESANANLENFVKGYDFGNTADIIAALRLIPQLFDYSNAFRQKRAGVEASKQEPAGGTSAPTAPATKVEQPPTGGFIPSSETVQQTANAMYFGPEPAGPVVGFNSTGMNPVVSQDAYQNEFAYTAAARQAAAQPVQMGEGFVEAPVQSVQMGQGFIDPMLAAQPIYDRLDADEEVGDEPTGGITRRRLDSGVWEFTYPDGRKVYSDNPMGPGGIRGEEGQRGSVTEGSAGWRPTGGYKGITTIPREGNTPIYTNVPGGSVLDPRTPNPIYRGNAGFSRIGGMNGITTIPREGNTPIYTNVPGGSVLDPRTPNPIVRGSAGWRPTGGYRGITTIPREGNTPIYTNVPGGSVLDPRTPNPVVRGPARPVRFAYNPEDYSVRVGNNYYNPFSGEEGTVVGYSQVPGVMRVRRPDGSIYATNIDPNMDMGYVRSDYQTPNAWMPRNQYGGQPYQIGDYYADGLVSSSQGTIQGGVPGAQVMRVRRPDGSDVYVNTSSYPSYLDEYHPYDRYRPRSNYVNPYTGEWQPPVRVNRY